MKQVIFVGWVRTGKPPVDGETTKNQFILAELKKYCKVTVLDFYEKNRHPWIYLQALWAFITQPNATIILSTSAKNVYGMLKLFKALHVHRDIIHWVIGGAFGKHVQEGRFQADIFNFVRYNLVQCKSMIAELEAAGVTNARFVSNFKPITYYPDLEKAIAGRKASDKLRFVFLSRIMPDKGCDYLLEAIQILNGKGLQDKFVVDFYGKIDALYQKTFMQKLNDLDNANYNGLLDLRTNEGYDTLATYHAMVFPTIHPTEGFSGIFIDAFISGLPILVSKWAYNEDFITHGELGLSYSAHDAEAIAKTMEHCINGDINLQAIAVNARNKASQYDAVNALSEKYIKELLNP